MWRVENVTVRARNNEIAGDACSGGFTEDMKLLIRLARRLAVSGHNESVTACLRLALHIFDEKETRETAIQPPANGGIRFNPDRKRGT